LCIQTIVMSHLSTLVFGKGGARRVFWHIDRSASFSGVHMRERYISSNSISPIPPDIFQRNR